MSSEYDIITFFELYDLYPESLIDFRGFLCAFFNAFKLSSKFGIFVRQSLIPIANKKYKVKYGSWNELISCYVNYGKTISTAISNS